MCAPLIDAACAAPLDREGITCIRNRVASAAEAAQGDLAEAPAGGLAGSHSGLADDGEGRADLAGRVARDQDPVVDDAHLPEDAPEVGAAVVDADADDDVLLGDEQPLDHRTQAGGRLVADGVHVRAIGDDGGDAARRHPTLLELGHLGAHAGERDRDLVVERGAARRVVVARGEQLRAVELAVGVEHAVVHADTTVEVAAAGQHRGRLLGALEGLDRLVVTFAHGLGVAMDEADRRTVVEQLREQEHLGRGHVIEGDVPESGHDGRAQGVGRELHGAGGAIAEAGVTQEVGQAGGGGGHRPIPFLLLVRAVVLRLG